MIANIRKGAVAAAAALFSVVLLTWHLEDEPWQRLLAASDGGIAELRRSLTSLPDPKTVEEKPMFTRPLWGPMRSDASAGIAPVPRYSAPLSVIAMRCSASVTLFNVMKKVLIAHGMKVAPYNAEIIFKASKSSFWETAMQKVASEGGAAPQTEKWRTMDDSLQYDMAVLETMHEAFSSNPESTVLFRTEPEHLMRNGYSVANGLKWMNTRFVYFYKSNLLDHLVCRVRECGDKISGHAVLASSGEPTQLCRKEDKTLAFVDTSALVERLHTKNNRINDIIEALGPYMDESMLASGKMAFAAEDLYAFEYTMDEDVFFQSLEEWAQFLSFALDVNRGILEGIMRQYQGRKQLRPHSEVIANIDEVIAALENSGLEHFLRY